MLVRFIPSFLIIWIAAVEHHST